ncbi:metallo-beta-lactamase superfamily protein [Xylogone sp. PMI_703]|nr:metallo-beta-lactamase superfamily protein [Xylogone sp. PMI_703]
MNSLTEIDALEVLVIVDNEVDPISSYQHPDLIASGSLQDIALRAPIVDLNRGNAEFELRLGNVCCGAHGLSLMITATAGEKRHTVLFDTAPEEHIWELNARRLKADIGSIELIQLSHWHRDHSGGMLKAITMINEAKTTKSELIVDLHPSRPDYRGLLTPAGLISLERDPTFEEIEAAGATVVKHDQPHTVLDDMFLVSGEIPRVTSYESGIKHGMRFIQQTGKWESDQLILDERFLMCKVKGKKDPELLQCNSHYFEDKGVVVFTGCSHAGVVNVTKHALELDGNSTSLYAVVGGYHLVGFNEAFVGDTVKDLRSLNPRLMIPGHCSGWRVKNEIERLMPGKLAPSTVGTRFIL